MSQLVAESAVSTNLNGGAIGIGKVKLGRNYASNS
jgi:hypothetical protein